MQDRPTPSATPNRRRKRSPVSADPSTPTNKRTKRATDGNDSASSASSPPTTPTVRRSTRLAAAPHTPPPPPPRHTKPATPVPKSKKKAPRKQAASLAQPASTAAGTAEAHATEVARGQAERRRKLLQAQEFYRKQVMESIALDRTMRQALGGGGDTAAQADGRPGSESADGLSDGADELSDGPSDVDERAGHAGADGSTGAAGEDGDADEDAEGQAGARRTLRPRQKKQTHASTLPESPDIPLYMMLEAINSQRHRNFAIFRLAQQHTESISATPSRQTVSSSLQVSLTPTSKDALWASTTATHFSLARHPDSATSAGLKAAQAVAAGLNPSIRSINASLQAAGVLSSQLPPTLPPPTTTTAPTSTNSQSDTAASTTIQPYPTTFLATLSYSKLAGPSNGTTDSYANFLKRCAAPFTLTHGTELINLPRLLDWHALGPHRATIFVHLPKTLKREMSNIKRLASHFQSFLVGQGHPDSTPVSDAFVNEYLNTLFPDGKVAVHKLATIDLKRCAGKGKAIFALGTQSVE